LRPDGKGEQRRFLPHSTEQAECRTLLPVRGLGVRGRVRSTQFAVLTTPCEARRVSDAHASALRTPYSVSTPQHPLPPTPVPSGKGGKEEASLWLSQDSPPPCGTAALRGRCAPATGPPGVRVASPRSSPAPAVRSPASVFGGSTRVDPVRRWPANAPRPSSL